MKIKSKIILCVIISVFSIITFGISINAMTNSEVTTKMNELKSSIPDGKFWNRSNYNYNPDSIRNVGCTHHDDYCDYSSSQGCLCGYFSGIQCHGFAKYMSNRIFGNYPSVTMNATNLNDVNGWKLYHKTNSNYSNIVLEPGDFVRCDDHS